MLDLYWIPLGAGARVVRLSGRIYEAGLATIQRRSRCDLFHSALVATIDGTVTTVEVAPVPDGDGHRRGVVGEGPVGSRLLGRWRVFRYEIRRWPGGEIPDLVHAVASPVRLSDDGIQTRAVLEVLAGAPTPVWGRNELRAGEMWNCNSVVAWTLSQAGLEEPAAESLPAGGRAPGWAAGKRVALRSP